MFAARSSRSSAIRVLFLALVLALLVSARAARRGACEIHFFFIVMVAVVEVVVVVLRGARAHEEGEHEGEEENADGGGTRGTSGKHGVCECVRARDGCERKRLTVFYP